MIELSAAGSMLLAHLNVEVYLIGHVLNDIGNALAGQAGLLAVVNAELIQLVELRQAGLVHAVDHTELCYQKVYEGGTVGNWPMAASMGSEATFSKRRTFNSMLP
jgi:hypothetical protein